MNIPSIRKRSDEDVQNQNHSQIKKWENIKKWISKRSGGTIDVKNTTKEKWIELKNGSTHTQRVVTA